MLIWLTGLDYYTLLTIASEMILVPYFLVGAYLLKLPHAGALCRGCRSLYLRAVVVVCFRAYASAAVGGAVRTGMLVFIYARRTHQLENALKRREMALIGLLLVAALPATWMLMG